MENSTNLSFAAVVKWIVIILSIAPIFKAYEGIVHRQTTTGYTRFEFGDTIRGPEAFQHGLKSLGVAALMWLGAWAIWFFWQRNEE